MQDVGLLEAYLARENSAKRRLAKAHNKAGALAKQVLAADTVVRDDKASSGNGSQTPSQGAGEATETIRPAESAPARP